MSVDPLQRFAPSGFTNEDWFSTIWDMVGYLQQPGNDFGSLTNRQAVGDLRGVTNFLGVLRPLREEIGDAVLNADGGRYPIY